MAFTVGRKGLFVREFLIVVTNIRLIIFLNMQHGMSITELKKNLLIRKIRSLYKQHGITTQGRG